MAPINDHSFASHYVDLCRKKRLRPLPMICIALPHSLDFTTDRVKMDDWEPILNSLKYDRTLRSVSVRNKFYHPKLLNHADSEPKARAIGKSPVVLTRFLIEWLTHSVRQCVCYSNQLTSLELEGIPVPIDCLAVLVVGLANTKSLQYLSLQRCFIGDKGCELICRTVADVASIKMLNLSECDLSKAAGPSLASALCKQKLTLYHDAWKQSLRYREPKFENMPGLRRLTLNMNPKLGNEAAIVIMDAIRDSLWFKALDLQQCGLSDSIGQDIIDLVGCCRSLVIVDVRLNSGIQEETLNKIARRLQRNELQSKSDYQWINLPQARETVTKRVSSAGNLRKQKQNAEESKSVLMRPRSAMLTRVKRPTSHFAYKNPLLMFDEQNIKRLKMKPPVPVFERRHKQPMKTAEQNHLPEIKLPTIAPKVSLHLDLQSQIESVAGPTESMSTPVPQGSIENRKAVDTKNSEEDLESRKLQQVLRELLETQEDRNKLLEEIKRNEQILAEERARREFVESKLETAKCDLAELKETLRKRDQDSRDYLMMSHKSVEELCRAFNKLVELLEVPSHKPNDSMDRINRNEDLEFLTKENIKRRFALIIRKTKSENLKRGFFIDDSTVLSRLQMTARYGRSEGHIRTSIEPIEPPVRFERDYGDTAQNITLPQLVSNFQLNNVQSTIPKPIEDSPSERARAIFTRIVNDKTLLNFNSRMY